MIMRHPLALLAFALVLSTTPAGAQDKAASATGTWKATFVTPNGRTFEPTYRLKQDGSKLTGTVSGPGGKAYPIEAGTVKDGKLFFKVSYDRDGNKLEFVYRGELKSDTIKGKVEIERDGEKRSFPWLAKRQKTDK